MEEIKKGGIFAIPELQNVRINIGEIIEEEEEWEPMGPHPMPRIATLRIATSPFTHRYVICAVFARTANATSRGIKKVHVE